MIFVWKQILFLCSAEADENNNEIELEKALEILRDSDVHMNDKALIVKLLKQTVDYRVAETYRNKHFNVFESYPLFYMDPSLVSFSLL